MPILIAEQICSEANKVPIEIPMEIAAILNHY